MLLSIVIPVYNVELYLEECLDSILVQPHHLLADIILIDDGSTDSSGKICDKYANVSKLVKTVHQKNQGPYQSRINGIKLASGTYVVFVDPDDKLLRNALQRISDLLLKYGKPDILIYNYINGKTINKTKIDKDLFGRIIIGHEKNRLYEVLCTSDEINAIWRKCIKKSILDGVAWVNEVYINCWEDSVISCQALDAAKSVCIVDEPLYYYRVNPNGITQSFTHAKYESIKKSYFIINNYAKKWDNEIDNNTYQKMLSYDWTRRCIDIIINILTSDLKKSEKKTEINSLYEDDVFTIAIYSPHKVRTLEQAYIGLAAKSNYRDLAFNLYLIINSCKKRIKTCARAFKIKDEH